MHKGELYIFNDTICKSRKFKTIFRNVFNRGEMLMCIVVKTVYSSRMITRPNGEKIGELYLTSLKVNYITMKNENIIAHLLGYDKFNISEFDVAKNDQNLEFFDKYFVKVADNYKAISRMSKLMKMGMCND